MRIMALHTPLKSEITGRDSIYSWKSKPLSVILSSETSPVMRTTPPINDLRDSHVKNENVRRCRDRLLITFKVSILVRVATLLGREVLCNRGTQSYKV